MGTRSRLITETFRGTDGTLYVARATVKITWAETTSNTAVTVSAQKIEVSAVSYVGGTNAQFRNIAKSHLMSTLQSMTATFIVAGTTVCTKTGFALGTTYTVSGSKLITRTHSNTTASLSFPVTNHSDSGTTIDIPAKPSYPVTYYGRSGTGAPQSQTKWFDEPLQLYTATPKKTGYTFKGWATSENNAKAGNPNPTYPPGSVYAANINQRLDLYAVWELDYQKPSITKLQAIRCDEDGEQDDDGGYAKVTFEYGVFNTSEPRYYEGTESPYQGNGVKSCTVTIDEETVSATLTATNGEAFLGDGTYGPDDTYDVTVTIEDTQTLIHSPDNVTVETTFLPTATFPIDINKTATVIGFFAAASDEPGVEGAFFGKNVDAPSYSLNGSTIADHIIEQGVSGIWTYRKWSSGIAECWGESRVTTDVNTAWGSLYRSANAAQENYPSGLFIARPQLSAYASCDDGIATWLYCQSRGDNTRTDACYFIRATTDTISRVRYMEFHAIGRWK